MRGFLLAVLMVVIVAVVAFGWRPLTFAPNPPARTSAAPSGTASRDVPATLRERGAEVAQETSAVASNIKETLAEAAISSKIKAKMALDDSVRARNISVSTSGTTVTLTGTVSTDAEHRRAVALARETDGVTRVVDHIVIGRP